MGRDVHAGTRGHRPRVYVGPDRSLQQAHVEAVLPRAQREVRRFRPEWQTGQLKQDGVVTSRSRHL